MSTKHKQNIFPNTSSLFKNLESINTHSKYLEKGDVNNHKFPPPQHELTDKSNTPREAGLKAEQPIISRSHSKPVSCLRGRGEEAAAASALPDTGRPEKPRSYCCKAFVRNCGKTAEKVWVLNPLIAKSVGVKTPTSPTGATPLLLLYTVVTNPMQQIEHLYKVQDSCIYTFFVVVVIFISFF